MRLSGRTFENAILFQNGAIGDFLMAIFLAELLQKAGCIREITIIVPRNLGFLKSLLGAYPYISAIEMSRRTGWRQLFNVIGQRSLVVIQPSLGKIPLRIKLLAWLLSRSAKSQLVGFQDKSVLCKVLYSKALVYKTDQLYCETIKNVVRALEAPVLTEVPELKITPDFTPIQGCGLHRQRYMVFHPGTSIPGRSFSCEEIHEVLRYVLERSPQMHVVLSGGPADRNWITEIRSGMRQTDRIMTAVGYSAQELAGLIKCAELYLGMDTGISHLACFLRARAIVVAHPGTAANWLPFYCPTATVLYRLKEERAVHQSREYLNAKTNGRVKPFGVVPIKAICEILDGWLKVGAKDCTKADLEPRMNATSL